MNIKMRMELEKKIVGQFVDDALAKGYRLAVSLYRGYDIEEMLLGSTDRSKILEEAFAGDECHIFVQPGEGPTVKDGIIVSKGWVYCVMGNSGYDVISDYSTSIEALLGGANKLADTYV